MTWNKKRIFVTGATGFVGSHLVHRMNSLGANVFALVLDEEGALPDATIFRGDVENVRDVERAISRSKPDIIFHLAAQPLVDTAINFPHDTILSNIMGSANILEASRKAGVKGVVFMSTDKVYGAYDGIVDENFELMGTDHPYNASKLCADILAQMYAMVYELKVIIVRSGNIYGGGDINFDRLIPGAIKSSINKEVFEIRSSGKLERDYLYIDDVIDAFVLFGEGIFEKQFVPTVVNLGAEKHFSVIDVVNIISEKTGNNIPLRILDAARFEIPFQHLDFSVAKSIGWFPKTNFENGIAKTVEWYKEFFHGEN